MSGQCKYDVRVRSILEKQPNAKLQLLIYRVFDERLSRGNIFTRLVELQSNDRNLSNEGNFANSQKQLIQIEAKQLQISEITIILTKFEPMLSSASDQQQFDQEQKHKGIKKSVNLIPDKSQTIQNNSSFSKNQFLQLVKQQPKQKYLEQQISQLNEENQPKNTHIKNKNKEYLQQLSSHNVNKSSNLKDENKANQKDPKQNRQSNKKTIIKDKQLDRPLQLQTDAIKNQQKQPSTCLGQVNNNSNPQTKNQTKEDQLKEEPIQKSLEPKIKKVFIQENQISQGQSVIFQGQFGFPESQVVDGKQVNQGKKRENIKNNANSQQINKQKGNPGHQNQFSSIQTKKNTNKVRQQNCGKASKKSPQTITKQQPTKPTKLKKQTSTQPGQQYHGQHEQHMQKEQSLSKTPYFNNQKLVYDKQNTQGFYDCGNLQITEWPPRLPKVVPRQTSPEQYSKLKQKLKRYLIATYHQYVKQAITSNGIFDKHQIFNKPLMDLTLFLRIYKDFEMKQLLRVNQITRFFKKYAINHIWVDVELFLVICYQVIQNKCPQSNKQPETITERDQLIERAKTFIATFSKQRCRSLLKLANKDNLDRIFNEYNKKDIPPTTHIEGNKEQIVDKFIKRNFQYQVEKWYEKKEIQPNKISRSRTKDNSVKLRDELTISSNIEKLQHQSQRNIHQLRALIDDTMSSGPGKQTQNKQKGRRLQGYALQESVQRKLLTDRKKVQSTAPSVYRQIEEYNLEHNEPFTSNEDELVMNLGINVEQPLLKDYFTKQATIKQRTQQQNNKSRVSIGQNKRSITKNTEKSPKVKRIPQLPPIDSGSPLKKHSSELNFKMKGNKSNNQFLGERFQESRHKNNRSQPGGLKNGQYQNNSKRGRSMKRLQINKSRNSRSMLQCQLEAFPMNSLIGDSVIRKLNEKQSQLVNKKLYHFLNDRGSKIIIKKDSSKKLTGKSTAPTAMPLSIQNAAQNKNIIKKSPTLPSADFSKQKPSLHSNKIQKDSNLMLNYKQQINQLFKHFNQEDREQDYIIKKQKQRSKGYLDKSQKEVIKNKISQVGREA